MRLSILQCLLNHSLIDDGRIAQSILLWTKARQLLGVRFPPELPIEARNFLHFTTSRPDLKTYSPGDNLLEGDRSPPSTAEVKNVGATTPFPISIHALMLN
jgi:hypothetical protein